MGVRGGNQHATEATADQHLQAVKPVHVFFREVVIVAYVEVWFKV
jgi:hypothetical protein